MHTVSVSEIHPLSPRMPGHDFDNFDWNDAHPLLSASQIDPDVLEVMPAPSPIGSLWRTLEMHVAAGSTDDPEFQRLRPAFHRLGRLHDYTPAKYDLLLAAASFDIYEHQGHREQLTRGVAAEQYEAIAPIVGDIEQELSARYATMTPEEALYTNDVAIADLRGALAKAVLMASLVRADVAALPASDRERQTGWGEYSHTLTVWPRGQKRAVRCGVGQRHKSIDQDVCYVNVNHELGIYARDLLQRKTEERYSFNSLRPYFHERRRTQDFHSIAKVIGESITSSDELVQSQANRMVRAIGNHALRKIQPYPTFRP